MQASSRRWYLLLTLIFLVFLLLNVLAPYSVDDYFYPFSFATNERITQVGEIFPSMVSHYTRMNGRVVSHFFAQLMLLTGDAVFNVVNAGMAVLLLLGLCRLTRRRERDCLQLAFFASALVLFLPTFAQVMLWLCGSCNYLWGSTLIVWAMAPFRDLLLEEEKSPRSWQLALLLPAYLAMGTVSENGAPAAILFMGLCILLCLHKRRRVPFRYWLYAVLSFAGFVFMIASPGSQKRNASSLGEGGSLLGKYVEPFQTCVNVLIDNMLVPLCIFAVVFVLAVCAKADRSRLTLSACLFVCGMASNFAMTATGYYPLRAMTCCLLMVLSATALLLPDLRGLTFGPLLKAGQAVLCLLAALMLLQALPLCYNRLQESRTRDAEVVAARDAGVRDVETFNLQGKSKFDVFYELTDITDQPGYFTNRAYARYWGLDSVVMTAER